jgi:PAS domain S-box-containing protein
MGMGQPRGAPQGDPQRHPKQPMRHSRQSGEVRRPVAVDASLASAGPGGPAPEGNRQLQRVPHHESQRQPRRPRHLASLVEGHSQVLELIAQGLPLPQILEAIARWVEAQSRHGVFASLPLLDRAGQHLQHGAAPSLPQTYNAAMHGLAIGPAVGSCGTAAFTKREVIVEDIAADPLWVDYRQLALSHGLRACWSTPLIGRTGNVLGTFALYYRQPQRPTTADRHLIHLVSRTAILAIECTQADEAAAHLAAIVTSADDAIASKTLEGIVTSWNASAERMFGYSAQEMIGQSILRIVPPERHQEEDRILARIRAGERIEHFETVRVAQDGRQLDVSLTISPIRDSKGTIIGASKIARDITERKRLQRRTHEALHALLELAATMVSDPDPTDRTEASDDTRRQEVDLWRGSDTAQRTDDVIRRFALLCGRVLGREQLAIITIDPETEQLRTVAVTGSAPKQERQFRLRLRRQCDGPGTAAG